MKNSRQWRVSTHHRWEWIPRIFYIVTISLGLTWKHDALIIFFLWAAMDMLMDLPWYAIGANMLFSTLPGDIEYETED